MLKLLDFYADWCGPCKIMNPVLEEMEKNFQGKIEFQRVDVEAEEQLAGQYDIRSIPTFVLVKEGKELDRRMGAMPKEMLKDWLDSQSK
jgi:thioredoxin 1